jgi:hypothetical protein
MQKRGGEIITKKKSITVMHLSFIFFKLGGGMGNMLASKSIFVKAPVPCLSISSVFFLSGLVNVGN